jgi:hypothetical protein
MALSEYKLPRDEQSLTIKVAVALACSELGISAADRARRETIAILMAPLSRTGFVSIERLKTYAISRYQMSK